MKLSTAILADKLKSKFGLQNKKALSDKLHLEQVLFYDGSDEMQPDKIYIYSQKPGARRNAGSAGAGGSVLYR